MQSKIVRLLAFIFVFAFVVTLPWWISVIILLFLTAYFPMYLEVMFFGFLFDILYSVRNSFPFTGLVLAVVFLLAVMFVKTRIRM